MDAGYNYNWIASSGAFRTITFLKRRVRLAGGRTLEAAPLPKKALPDSAPALPESPYMPAGVSWSDAIQWGGLGNRYSWAPENLDLPYQNVGLVVRKNEVEKRADIWVRVLRAVRRGINAWYEDPRLARSVLAKYTKATIP